MVQATAPLHRCLACGDLVRLKPDLQGLPEVPGDCTCGAETTFLRVGSHLCIWTIYDHPRDYPTSFVARLSVIHGPTPVMTSKVFTGATLEAVRDQLPEGLASLPRNPQDDPVIVECWL